MKKSQLRQLIREEIKKSYVNEGMLDNLGKFIYKANALVFPKMTAGKFHLLFMKHKLDIRSPEVKAYIEKTLPTQRVKDEFYALLKGNTKESVNEVQLDQYTVLVWHKGEKSWESEHDGQLPPAFKSFSQAKKHAKENHEEDKDYAWAVYDNKKKANVFVVGNTKESVNEAVDPSALEVIYSLFAILGGSLSIKFGMDMLAKIVDGLLKKLNPSEILKLFKNNTSDLKAAAQKGPKEFEDKLTSITKIPFTIKRNEGTCGYDRDAKTGKKFKTPGGL